MQSDCLQVQAIQHREGPAPVVHGRLTADAAVGEASFCAACRCHDNFHEAAGRDLVFAAVVRVSGTLAADCMPLVTNRQAVLVAAL